MDMNEPLRIIKELYGMDIRTDYYKNIAMWRQWWSGYVQKFHKIKIRTENGSLLERDLYQMKMAKKVCEDWASFLLNEETKITVNHAASQNFLTGNQGDETGNKSRGVLGNINFWTGANELVEKAFWSGTGAFVMKLDDLEVTHGGSVKKTPDCRIRMEYLSADGIIPLSLKNGEITEVAFISKETKRGKVLAYLEVHLQDEQTGLYHIHNHYFEVIQGKYKPIDLPDNVIPVVETGSPYPFFSIIRPNISNPIPGNNGLGRSVFADAIDQLKGCDLAYNNLNQDLFLGGKKLFYNRRLTETVYGEDGEIMQIAPDDVNQQLFCMVGDELLEKEQLLYEFNPSLRIAENTAAIQAELDYLSFKCGMGARQYRFDGNARSIITATQYTGEKQELKQSGAKHSIIIDHALRKLMRVVLWAGKEIIGLPVDDGTDIQIAFSDGYIVSDEERRETDRKDVDLGAMPLWEYRMKWYNEDEETAKQHVEKNEMSFGENQYLTGEDEP